MPALPLPRIGPDPGAASPALSADDFIVDGSAVDRWLKGRHRFVVWFRNDLRIRDNPILSKVALYEGAKEVVPCYFFDPRVYRNTTSFGSPKTGFHRARFLLEAVADLREQLRALGSDLLVGIGRPEDFLPLLLADPADTTVLYQTLPGTEEEEHERAVQQRLRGKAHLTSLWGGTLYDIKQLPFKDHTTLSDMPDSFHEFRSWMERDPWQAAAAKLLPKPRVGELPLPDNPGNFQKLHPDKQLSFSSRLGFDVLPTPSELGQSAAAMATPPEPRGLVVFRGGERAAKARLRYYLWEKDCMGGYFETRNGMLGTDYTSKFSAWLAHGCISARYIASECSRYEIQKGKSRATYWMIFELLVRDFARFFCVKHGRRIFTGDVGGNPLHTPAEAVLEQVGERLSAVELTEPVPARLQHGSAAEGTSTRRAGRFDGRRDSRRGGNSFDGARRTVLKNGEVVLLEQGPGDARGAALQQRERSRIPSFGTDVGVLRPAKPPGEWAKEDIPGLALLYRRPTTWGNSRDQLLARWKAGQTGVPLIDANMRELAATGYMSARGRMVTASYFTKDLKIDWQLGADHFESLLIDYDVCVNWGTWMGVGAWGPRRFDVAMQAKEYDAEGEYVLHWLPELAKVPAAQLHEPWLLTPLEQQLYGVRLVKWGQRDSVSDFESKTLATYPLPYFPHGGGQTDEQTSPPKKKKYPKPPVWDRPPRDTRPPPTIEPPWARRQRPTPKQEPIPFLEPHLQPLEHQGELYDPDPDGEFRRRLQLDDDELLTPVDGWQEILPEEKIEDLDGFEWWTPGQNHIPRKPHRWVEVRPQNSHAKHAPWRDDAQEMGGWEHLPGYELWKPPNGEIFDVEHFEHSEAHSFSTAEDTCDLEGEELSEATVDWWESWRQKLSTWFMASPSAGDRLGECLGALSLHLGSRLQGAWRAWLSLLGRPLGTSAPPPPTQSLVGPEANCDWVTLRGESELGLPEFPEFPAEFRLPTRVPLPPIPGLSAPVENLGLLSQRLSERGQLHGALPGAGSTQTPLVGSRETPLVDSAQTPLARPHAPWGVSVQFAVGGGGGALFAVLLLVAATRARRCREAGRVRLRRGTSTRSEC